MSIPKKGSRRICVDQSTYRWVGENIEPIGGRITVQEIAGKGAVLILLWKENVAIDHILPSQIASSIQEAQTLGWKPYESGAPIEIVINFIA
jgi:hypothetical protein